MVLTIFLKKCSVDLVLGGCHDNIRINSDRLQKTRRLARQSESDRLQFEVDARLLASLLDDCLGFPTRGI